MAIGYNMAFTLASGNFSPVSRVSVANNLTMGSGGTALTIPWVENTNSGSADTSSSRLVTAIRAAAVAILNDFATTGAPT